MCLELQCSGEMAAARVPIVDVNSFTAVEAWPLILKAIERADFISLDLVRF